jgi:hypothetical protein
MTKEEFNIKYKDFIETRTYLNKYGELVTQSFDGLEFDIKEVTLFLDNIFESLSKIPGFTYSQIKLKFGMTRFYSNISSSLSYIIEKEIDSIIKNLNIIKSD